MCERRCLYFNTRPHFALFSGSQRFAHATAAHVAVAHLVLDQKFFERKVIGELKIARLAAAGHVIVIQIVNLFEFPDALLRSIER